MQGQSKSLHEILMYKAQHVTGFRFVLIYLAVYLSPSYPQTSGMMILTSVILDYFDGMVARRYKQVSYFGEIFDWITDLCSYAATLFWWNTLEPQLLIVFFTLFFLEVLMMMVDTVSKCYGYTPKLEANSFSTYILNYTMDLKKKGYACSGIGYWNEILHFLCIISRILFLTTQSNLWYYCFLINIPFSISYVWMHLAYSVNILERWN
jgi:phosphatidylglycerophosphate synthase